MCKSGGTLQTVRDQKSGYQKNGGNSANVANVLHLVKTCTIAISSIDLYSY